MRKISPALISSVLKLARFQSHSVLFIGPEVHKHVKNNDNSIFSSKSWISGGNFWAFVKWNVFFKALGEGTFRKRVTDGPASGLAPHQSYRAEAKRRTSLDWVLQLHHCAHFRWGEAYAVLKLSDYISSELLEPERKYGLGEPEQRDPGES